MDIDDIDIHDFLHILHVNPSKLTLKEKNALQIFLIPREKLENANLSNADYEMVSLFVKTLAFIMERKVHDIADDADIATKIRAMGWQDDFADDRIACFTQKDSGCGGWGHRIPSDWAEGWLRDWFSEYNFTVMERLDLLPPQQYDQDGITPVF